MHSQTKDPARVQAGREAARRRWGDHPRTVRLDDLTPEQARLVRALVDAARSTTGNEKPAPVIETTGSGLEVRRASVEPR